jgi:tetratricopeptide (TPR) repeat protein
MNNKRSQKISIIALFFLFFSAIPLFSAYAPLEIEAQYIKQGRTMIELGRYKDAINMFDTVLKMNPSSVDAYAGKGVCYELLGNAAEAEAMYYKAKELDPNVVLPEVSRYKALDKERNSKSSKELREKYAKDKIKADTGGSTINAGLTVEQSAEGRYTVKDSQAKEGGGEMLPSIQSRTDVQYWHRGGLARTGALGEIEHVLPDQSTAMDSYARGIEAGSLFRKVVHHFKLTPSFRHYKDTLNIRPERVVKTESMMFTLEGTRGESVWPNQAFFNGMVPYFMTSYKKYSDADNPLLAGDLTDNNAGMLFGGKYFAGFKPIPQLAFAGSFGYEYAPYHEAINDTAREIVARSLEWQFGGAGYFPLMFNNNDALDFAASFGSYRPPKNYARLFAGEWLALPYSFFNGYSLMQSDVYAMPGGLTVKDSDLLEASGFEAKANLHYMYGDGLHEGFIYFGVPVGIKYTLEEQYEVRAEDSPVSLSSTTQPKTELGSGAGFSFAAGVRNDIVYVSPGVKYEFNYFENNFTTAYGAFSGVEKTAGHRITGGLNITPVRMIAAPAEFVYAFKSVENETLTEYTTEMIVRFGVEARPIPMLALRGGFSYEQQKVSYVSENLVMPGAGTQENPYMNALGGHFGAGIEMAQFEFNLAGIIKDIYPTPEFAGVDSGATSYFAIIADINLYM